MFPVAVQRKVFFHEKSWLSLCSTLSSTLSWSSRKKLYRLRRLNKTKYSESRLKWQNFGASVLQQHQHSESKKHGTNLFDRFSKYFTGTFGRLIYLAKNRLGQHFGHFDDIFFGSGWIHTVVLSYDLYVASQCLP